MNRIVVRQPIAEAIALLPARIRERVGHTDWLCGVDPVFVGLHDAVAKDGRSYAETAHVAWPCHQRGHEPSTVVLPQPESIHVVVHELAHVLDEAIGFDSHDPDPVCAYAKRNGYEAFACAFALWVAPELAPEWHDREVLARDEQTLALFEELARA